MMKGKNTTDKKEGFFSDLEEVYKATEKIDYVDDHSKPLKIFCAISGIIITVIIIAAYLTHNPVSMIMGACLLFILFIMLIMNNVSIKNVVKFKVGRPVIAIMVLLIIQLLIMTVFIAYHPIF